MKYEKPEMLIIILNGDDVITDSNLENWGSGDGDDLDDLPL